MHSVIRPAVFHYYLSMVLSNILAFFPCCPLMLRIMYQSFPSRNSSTFSFANLFFFFFNHADFFSFISFVQIKLNPTFSWSLHREPPLPLPFLSIFYYIKNRVLSNPFFTAIESTPLLLNYVNVEIIVREESCVVGSWWSIPSPFRICVLKEAELRFDLQ